MRPASDRGVPGPQGVRGAGPHPVRSLIRSSPGPAPTWAPGSLPAQEGCTTASILITGATNGLGLALAEELAEAVHQLLPHGCAPQRPVPVAQRFGAGQYIADRSAPAETQRLAAEVAARRGRLDVLVDNAGVASLGTAPSEACRQTDTSSGWR
ncbi:SDR family NAD(P)-dependent oxidoreductase [Streptomyces sp. NPDC018964]|uniref:SDR family NAD(P)-dependent oxidoreductase n=1 Tax=Streptomyces sp. NPDC018964 TaxID=3365058 RepID=UPI00378D9944